MEKFSDSDIKEILAVKVSGGESRRVYDETRIIHTPTQITSMDQIKVGDKFVEMHLEDDGRATQFKTVFEALELPEQDPDKSWWIKVLQSGILYKTPMEGRISLADRGVVSYKNGVWNTINWLERVPEDKPADQTPK